MADKDWPRTEVYAGPGPAQPPNDTGTRILGATSERVVITLPTDGSWHGDDGERRFLTMTPQVAQDLMHALEWWKDER